MDKLTHPVKSANPTAAILRLEEVRETILAQPDRFVMEVFYRDPRETHDCEAPDIDIFDEGCGTACCIAGWAIALEARRHQQTARYYVFGQGGTGSYMQSAANLVGMDLHMAGRLFNAECWPCDLRQSYYAGDPDQKTAAGVKVIDLWIAALRGEENSVLG